MSAMMRNRVSRLDGGWTPSAVSLAGKVLLLATLAGALALGHRHPLAVWCVLLEGFYCAAAALDVAIAVIGRESSSTPTITGMKRPRSSSPHS
jgi:hypothetical protein